MSQMIQRKQTRSYLSTAFFILPVLIFVLSLWPQPKVAQAQQWSGTTDIYNANSGNVGIGSGSQFTPAAKLDIRGDLKIGSANPLTLNKSAVKTFDLNMTNEGSAGHAFRIGLGGWGTDYFSIENSVHDTIYHKFTANGNSYLNAIGGNVGIGTTTPNAKLDVFGSSGDIIARVGDTDAGTGRLKLGWENSNSRSVISAWSNTGYKNMTIDAANLALQSNSTGNVGIGTILPSAKLHVRGPDGVSAIGAPSSVYLQAGSGVNELNKIAFLNANGGSIGLIAGLVETAGSYPNSKGALILGTQNLGSTNEVMRLTSSGYVGIGTTAPTAKFHVVGDATVAGNMTVSGNIAAKYQDVAEWVTSPRAMPAGTVVILHPKETNQVLPSIKAYDTRVAGVISEMPGLLLGEAGDGKVKVATTGRVKVKVDATKKPVQVGDLLVTSDKEGIAMKSEPLDLGGVPIHRPGTLIGKALEPLSEGEGEILVLLSLQ